MFRVRLKGDIHPFKKYTDALKFIQEHGGTLFQKIYQEVWKK